MKLKSRLSAAFKKTLTIISPKLNTKVVYYFKFKRRLNLKDPVTLDEKIQWLKFNTYYKNPLITKCADKYAVREYIKDCGCEELLNDLIGVYKDPKDIIWDKLPNKFALKYNYGSGLNIICEDKSKLNIKETIKELYKWKKNKQHLLYSEMHYADIDRKYICEKFIEGNKEGRLPYDYKFYCFNGIAKYVMICMGRETGHPKYYFFDENLKLARINKDSINAKEEIELNNKEAIKLMFEYANKLSKPFPFVRADFYLSNNKPVFGELTFTPAGGMDNNRLPQTDIMFGELLQLPK